MLLIDCPYCGKRPELEFSHAGQAHIARAKNPAEVSVQEWTDFLYMRDNVKGVHAERWRHTHGCARFFNALRDTTTDHFIVTYKAGEAAPAGAGLDAGSGPSANAGPGASEAESYSLSAGASAEPVTGTAAGAAGHSAPVAGSGANSGASAPKVTP
jgi:sarcosine oxidase subunit delta